MLAIAQFAGLVEVPATIAGAALASNVQGIMPLALSFGGGAMLSALLFTLVPEIYMQPHVSPMQTGQLVTLGYVLTTVSMAIGDAFSK